MTIEELNHLGESAFVETVGFAFQNSPWVARDTWRRRPFLTRDRLLFELSNTVLKSGRNAQVELLQSHPDWATRLAKSGKLPKEPIREQVPERIVEIDSETRKSLQKFNDKYRKKFGFPFVICEPETGIETILTAIDHRSEQDRDSEIDTALAELFKIAKIRVGDLVV